MYDFKSGNRDLLRFLKNAADANLWVNLRIGPYVCAEWNYGGLPVWLREDTGIVFRTYDQQWLRVSVSITITISFFLSATRDNSQLFDRK